MHRDTTAAVEENDKFVSRETDRVLGTAKEIEELVAKLEAAMSKVSANVADTSETGGYIKSMAENIRNTASILNN